MLLPINVLTESKGEGGEDSLKYYRLRLESHSNSTGYIAGVAGGQSLDFNILF